MAYAIRIDSAKKIRLSDYDADANGGLSKEEGKQKFEKLDAELDVIQEELFAAGTHSVLTIFQGMDTSGKDGAIRTVSQSCNPQGMHVSSFKVPTEEELSHDFLWRIHKQVPRKGQIGVFNRSHYEDVLVVRVHNLVPKQVWEKRYEHINHFEQLLTDSNTIILKFFLHITSAEQEQRLLDREKEIDKAWKLSAGDWKERQYWDDYQNAYADVLSKCSSKSAPWYIVPANRKWFRNLAIAEALVNTLGDYRKEWNTTLKAMSEERLKELTLYRQETKLPKK